MREGYQVSTITPSTRTDRDSGATESEVRDGGQITPSPPQQDGQIQWGSGQRSQSCARETEKLGITRSGRLMGAVHDVVLVGVERNN